MYNDPIIRPDPAKINKEKRREILISMIMNEIEGRINNRLPTRGRARSCKIWFRLYVVFMFYYYNCQNNLILIVVVIF
jgi:hypothetical protein